MSRTPPSPSLKLSQDRLRKLQAVLDYRQKEKAARRRRFHPVGGGWVACVVVFCLMLFFVAISLLYEYAL